MAAIDTNLAFALRPAASLRQAAALLRGLATRLSAPADPDYARARRDFVREMTARNPDAFSSDLDVQAMMLHYPTPMTARSAAMALTITRAETPEDLDAARALIRAFVAWAMEHVAKGENPNPSVFANLEAEIAGLPGCFGPPSGCLLLARLDGAPVGCVAFYGQDATTMEIKRMFVSPDAWGHGVGAQMLKVLLAEAEAAGYVRYRLSTHRALHAAQSLYRRVGFRDVPGSPDFPGIVEGVDICMEMIPVRETKEESRLA